MPLPVVPSCSNNGIYVNGTCNCNAGWTGKGDYNPVPGLDCGINELSIVILAYISVIFGMLAMVCFLYYFYERLKLSKKLDVKLKFAIAYSIQAITGNIYDIFCFSRP